MDSTGVRIYRWALRAGWTGPTAIDHGWAWLEDTMDVEGNALQQMQKAAFEEGMGNLFVAADGTLTFFQRDAPLTQDRQRVVQATFTDRDGDPAGACYSDIVPVADSIPVFNTATMQTGAPPTPPGGTATKPGLPQTYGDPVSVAWYGPRVYPSRTDLALHDWNDDLAIAILIVVTHANNELRVERIVINANQHHPDIWAVACSVQLLDRVRVVRHFPGGYVLDAELIVQGISHHMEGAGLGEVPGTWQVEYTTTMALDDVASFCAWDDGQWDDCRWSI